MYKSKLQELCHKHSWELPEYRTVKEGMDHCPRFITTVSVNGRSFDSCCESKSSKESQNVAAQLAFEYFSAPVVSQSMCPSPPSPSLPFSSHASGSNEVFRLVNDESLQQKHGGDIQTSISSETSRCLKDDGNSKELLHLYKSRLQNYLQKNSRSIPAYSSEFDGPPHARRFRVSVTVDGATYHSSESYPTLKDAEHSAAKTALESLSQAEIQQDEGLFKTLLQELAQQRGFHLPSYTTSKSGPPHSPTFVSTVEVGGETYQGKECKTKKQSEMNAAKAAYNILMERNMVSNCSPVFTSTKNIEAPSSSLQPTISENCEHSGGKTIPETNPESVAATLGGMDRHPSALSHVSARREPLEWSSSSLTSVFNKDLPQNIQQKPIHAVEENLDSEVEGTSRSSAAFADAPSSSSMPYGLAKSDDSKLDEGMKSPGSKILIFRRESNMEIPEGASMVHYNDEKWVAVRVAMNQDQ